MCDVVRVSVVVRLGSSCVQPVLYMHVCAACIVHVCAACIIHVCAACIVHVCAACIIHVCSLYCTYMCVQSVLYLCMHMYTYLCMYCMYVEPNIDQVTPHVPYFSTNQVSKLCKTIIINCM